MKTIIGIDPGMTGAIAIMDLNELIVYDMPVYEITKGKSVRKRIDILALRKILFGPGPCHAFIEQVSAQPGNGAAAAFTYGWGCGVIEAVINCAEIPFTFVTPQKWKKTLQVPADKDGARFRASQLMPSFSHNWDRKKDHGRAESALIALYGFQQ